MMPEPTLDLAVASRETGDALAILSTEGAMSYRELLAATERSPAATSTTTMRSTQTPETLVALHRALRQQGSFAPVHPATPPREIARLEARLLAAAPLQPGVYVTTSGSTGRPKLVELPWSALAAHARMANLHLGLRSDDRWLVSLPLSHTGGLAIALRCLVARAAIVLAPAPPLDAGFSQWLAERIAVLGVTRLSLVPAQLDRLLRANASIPRSLRSVLIGGQAMAPDLLERALAQGWPIVSSYGLSETSGLCVASGIGERLPAGVVGRALPGVRLRLREGLLEIATPARARRVLDAEDAITTDGWLRTSDRAEISQDGLLRVLGRADDVIVSAGHKLDPLEIEAALVALPCVESALVIGRPDPIFGATLLALIVPAPACAGLDEHALLHLVRAGLAGVLPSYKQPRSLRLVSDLPLLANGKLDRASAHHLTALGTRGGAVPGGD